MPGRVYQSQNYEYIEDVVNDANFPRAKVAQEIGIVSGFGMPIMSRDKRVLAVVECFSLEHERPNEDLLESIAQLGEIAGTKTI